MTPYVDATAQLVSEVFVRDAAQSRAFYESLGFTVLADRGTFVILGWEGHHFFLDERPEIRPPDHPVANVRVMVPEVDALWQRAQQLGARIVQPIGDRSYGLRDFTIADPDGFGVRFGSWLATGHA
jgi:catechol 2,3-dioxygenase-like lactoylglutathione lyase family enzyme